MATYHWNGVSDDWTVPTDWTPSGVPGVGDSSTIDAAGVYTVGIAAGETITVDQLAMSAADATLQIDGEFRTADLEFNAGTIALTGVISDSTVHANGGVFSYNFGTFSNVTYRGLLDLGDSGVLQVQNGLSVTDAAGTGAGTINVTGNGATLIVNDSSTLDSVTINVGSDTGFDSFNANGTSFTLGTGAVVNSVGLNGLQLGGSAVVTNNGVINAGVAGGQASISATGFVNAGALNVTGGQTLNVSSTDFGNTGTVFVDASSDIEIQGSTIAASQASGGTVDIEGTLNLNGATIDLGPTSAFANTTLGGTLENGVIVSNGGTITYNFGTLLADTFRGTLDLGASGVAIVLGGLTVTDAAGTGAGTINVTGTGASLIFNDATTLDNVTLNVGSDTGFDSVNANGTSFTLGSGAVVNSVGLNGLQLGGSAVVTNNGVINAGVAGGQASISATGFVNAGALNVTGGQTLNVSSTDFGNTGTVFVDASSDIEIQGSTIAASQAVGGTVDIEGTLNLNGATIDLGPTSAFANTTLGGTLENGVIVSNGGTITYNFGTLLADTFRGTLDLGNSGVAIVLGGLTVTDAAGTGAGTINVTGTGASLIFNDATTLDNVTINVGSDTGFDTVNANNATLVLGAGVVVNSVGVNGLQLGGNSVVVNNGRINAGVAGGTAAIDVGSFTNAGTIAISNKQALSLTSQTGTATNTGLISVITGGSLTVGSALAGTGTVAVGSNSFAEFGGAVASSQTIALQGTGVNLVLDQPAAVAAKITGFVSSDRIDLIGFTTLGSKVQAAGSKAVVTGTSPTATLNLGTLARGQGYGLVSDGRGSSFLITGQVINGRAGGNANIVVPTGNAIINAQRFNNKITVGSGDAVINAGLGQATVRAGDGNVVVNISGSRNQVTTGNGSNVVSGNASIDLISLGSGNDQVRICGNLNAVNAGAGNNTVDLTGNFNLVKTGNGDDTITTIGRNDLVLLSGGTDTVSVSGTSNAVFLGTGNDTINDAGKNLNVFATTGVGNSIVTGVASDPSFVLDLVGGVGGYTSGAQAYAALVSDGNGGSLLSLGAGSSVDFAGVLSTQLSAKNFAVIPHAHFA